MEVVILIGIQATGKSTFYTQRFSETHVRVNLDTVKSRRREQALIEACFADRRPFVVDNTNVTREERARYIGAARAAGFRVVGYYFQSGLGASIERNRGREPGAVVPAAAIAAIYHRLQVPALDEGFDHLYAVTITGDGGFAVQEWADGV